MSSRQRINVGAILLLAVGQGLAGCSGTRYFTGTVAHFAALAPAVVAPRLLAVTLSGVVTERTPTGLESVPEVNVYCETCGEGHTFASTDSNGRYSFSGVWVVPGAATQLLVWKKDYTADGHPAMLKMNRVRTDVIEDSYLLNQRRRA